MKFLVFFLSYTHSFFMKSPTKGWWYSDRWDPLKRVNSVKQRWTQFHDVYPVSPNLLKLYDVRFMEVSMPMEMFSHIVHGSFMKTEMVSFESIIQEKAILKGKKNLLIHFTSMVHQNLSCDF